MEKYQIPDALILCKLRGKDDSKDFVLGIPSGTVLPFEVTDILEDEELRIAFDFDGVLADDETEAIYKESGLPKRCMIMKLRIKMSLIILDHWPIFFKSYQFFKNMKMMLKNRILIIKEF